MTSQYILSNYLDHLLNGDINTEVRLEVNGISIKSQFGFIEFTPEVIPTDAKAIIYSCGVHGNETAPIEMMNDLIKSILNGSCVLYHPLLIIFGNIDAIRAGRRFVQDNLNRMFCDEYLNYPENNIEARRAKQIQISINDFFCQYKNQEKIHYDLHTAIRKSHYEKFVVYPFLGDDRDISKFQITTFCQMEIDAVLLMHKSATTLSYYSSSYHLANAYTIELGAVKPFGKNNRQDFAKVERVLYCLISNTDNYPEGGDIVLCEVIKELIRNDEQYEFKISNDTPNFTRLEKGSLVASDSVETYYLERDGDMIVFPNPNVKIGQRSGLIVRRIN